MDQKNGGNTDVSCHVEASLNDLNSRKAVLAAAKSEVLSQLQMIFDALSSGSLEIEMYVQDAKTGHSEVTFLLKGDYLGTSRRVHLISTQDWSTFPR
jgi:hypothetical protein